MKMAIAANGLRILMVLMAVATQTVSGGDGFFYLQRVELSCMEIAVLPDTNGNGSANSLTYDWSEISNLTINYTTYSDAATNQTFYAQIGALTVSGAMDNYSLNYQCPPLGYNGVGNGCNVRPNTQLVILHINALDNKLYAIDIILSGAPFPLEGDLKENKPPFGKARITLPLGILVKSTGYFQIRKNRTSDQCPNKNISAHKLPHPLPSNYGYGLFGIQSFNFVTNSTWIMDDPNSLLIVTAGTNYYYFNATGFFFYDASSNTCTWSSTCDYVCEAYNYDSRFLDYSGEWVILNKWGTKSMKPFTAEIWIGNAIDAAGVFPIVMYTDKKTGHYIGLDKLDTIPSVKMGATYWYTDHGDTIPKTSISKFKPSVVDAGCVKSLNQWTGIWKSYGSNVKSNFMAIMFILILLNIF